MEGQRLEEIPVKDITPNPRQPRQHFDKEQIDNMARSIETFGVVQPIVVRPVGTEYELIAGERRWRAAQEAGLERIPAVVKQSTETDSLEMALIENLHRSDLNGIEEATAYQQLLEDFAITHEELSRRVGKSRAAISNAIRLLQLPPRIQKDVMEGRISTGHARALLAMQDSPELQEELRARIIEGGLSVRQTEELCGAGAMEPRAESEPVDATEAGTRAAGRKAPLPGEVQQMLDRLAEILDARVKGSLGKRKGKVVIEFRGVDDLQRIVNVVTGPWEDAPEAEGVSRGGSGPTEAEPARSEDGREKSTKGREPADHWSGDGG
jgi:ParB family chromosome partitioning protein